MLKKTIIGIIVAAISIMLSAGKTMGQDQRRKDAAAAAADAAPATDPVVATEEAVDNGVSAQDNKMLDTAQSFAAECTKILERWVNSKEITEDKLFSFLYYPIPDTNPSKFHTDYDQLADRDVQSVLEKYLSAQPDTVFAVLTDRNGYIATHNIKYSQPLTGDRAKDLVGSRNKRIFADKTGLASARNEKPYLFQVYKRDTGQFMVDLSIPIYVNGQHWGAIRLGYLKAE